MARPLRFRYDPSTWSEERVRSVLLEDLDANIGATIHDSWYVPPDDHRAVRFHMANGDVALFCWTPGRGGRGGETPTAGGFWIGNTETPSALWRTDKYGFDDVPPAVSTWAERELLAQLQEEAPWLAEYPSVSWFFLPVLLSKDGRETTRRYFRTHSAGFPGTDPETALGWYESFLDTGVLDDYRERMAAKLGTSGTLDRVRMDAAMSEFTVAWLLDSAGYDVTPEISVTTGHSIDFRAQTDGDSTLVEVTRPLPPGRRNASTGPAALRDTAGTKASGQLARHGGGITLFVDCSGFDDTTWDAVCRQQPSVSHKPAVVFRARPTSDVEAYTLGSVPLELSSVIDRV